MIESLKCEIFLRPVNSEATDWQGFSRMGINGYSIFSREDFVRI